MKAVIVEKPEVVQQVTLKDVFKVGRREVVECMIEEMREGLLARRKLFRAQLEEAREVSAAAYEAAVEVLEKSVERTHDLEALKTMMATFGEFKKFEVSVTVPGSTRAKRFSYRVSMIRADKWNNNTNLHRGTIVLTKKQRAVVKTYLDAKRVPEKITRSLEAIKEELLELPGLKRRVNLQLTRKVLFDTQEGKNVLDAFKALAGTDLKRLVTR